jgi:hypothetical protein
MSKHTAAPWYAHNIGLGPKGKGPYTFPLGTEPEEAAANARLIAAAPELLANVEIALDVALSDGYSETSILVIALRAVIAKAKGE